MCSWIYDLISVLCVNTVPGDHCGCSTYKWLNEGKLFQIPLSQTCSTLTQQLLNKCQFIPSALPEVRWWIVKPHLSYLKNNNNNFFSCWKSNIQIWNLRSCSLQEWQSLGKKSQWLWMEILVSNFWSHFSSRAFTKNIPQLWPRDHIWGVSVFCLFMDFGNFHSPFLLANAYSSAVKQLRVILKAKRQVHHLDVPKGYFGGTGGTKAL